MSLLSLLLLLASPRLFAEDAAPPAPTPGGLPPVAGADLRLLLEEAGFGEVAGERVFSTLPVTSAPGSGEPPQQPLAANPLPPPVPPPMGQVGAPGEAPPPPAGSGDGAGSPPPQPHTTHTHQQMPPEKHGNAPGFALQVVGGARFPAGAAAGPAVLVGRERFTLRDDGKAPDARAGDGTWSGMIERYPADTPLVLLAGEQELLRAAIALQPSQSIPVMALSLP